MPVCPLEFRYGRKQARDIFSSEMRIQDMLDVEAALARAHAELGTIPKRCAVEITRKASIKFVDPCRVDEIERETRHDVMALVKALGEQVSAESAGCIHLGATSYDIVDTALALQMRRGLDLLDADLALLWDALAKKARRHRDTPMLGRTHGQHAIPITFGLKMAVFAAEVARHRARLAECRGRVCVGKMTGAVGTAASFGGMGLALQTLVMDELGLGSEEAATQIVQRDRHIEAVGHIVNIATSLEKFATEIRNLQRSEINEAAEAFDSKSQVGSSTMPQKQNPITCENVTGLARVLRGFYTPLLEGAVQWHERDLSNSASERFVLPHVFILADDIIVKMAGVIENLRVNTDAMARNIASSGGFMMAESVMMGLVEAGMGRQEAHELVREVSHAARRDGKGLREALRSDSRVKKLLSPARIDSLMDPRSYLGQAGAIVDAVVGKGKKTTTRGRKSAGRSKSR